MVAVWPLEPPCLAGLTWRAEAFCSIFSSRTAQAVPPPRHLLAGHKTFQLRIDLPGSQHSSGADGGGWGLAAICFASHGDTLMGYCDGEGVALGWRLQRGWTHRLARGPAVLGPSKMVVVPAAAALRQMHQTPPGHVALGYSLKFETAGRLRLAHHDAVLAIDLDHA